MSPVVVITRVSHLPPGFDRLVDASVGDGHGFVERMRRKYVSGENDFSRSGEGLWVALRGDEVVGVCGLNCDPYIQEAGIGEEAEIGRVRHLYVRPDQRLGGVGRRLVQAVIEEARGHFALLRLRTHSPDADRFYRRIGFVPSDVDPYGTHLLPL